MAFRHGNSNDLCCWMAGKPYSQAEGYIHQQGYEGKLVYEREI